MVSKEVQVLEFQHLKRYEFKYVDKNHKILTERDCKEYLMKWNVDKNLKILTYNFKGEYELTTNEELLLDFFRTETVLSDLGCPILMDSEAQGDNKMTMEIERVPCTLLSTDFFDRIYDSGIVLPDGTIRKCFEEYADDIVVADELRSMLLAEESDTYSLYGEEERAELLFRIFRHLCIGGCLNQYEDNVEPYIFMAKTLYKDVVCVRKTGSPKKITIMSKVYKVTLLKNNVPVYPSSKQHEQDFAFVILNPILKEIIILHHVCWFPTKCYVMLSYLLAL